jgi:DNA-binding transcriptional ArsR family regulator
MLCVVPEPTMRITDPQRIRALTHPLRLELMDVLAEEGEATATRCAELTGESVASCSFHLRMLAKYGYIEPAERTGREKPWRLVSRSRDLRPDAHDPASVRAVEAMATLFVEHEVERIRTALAAWPSEPAEWMNAVTVSGSGFWATAEELTELSETLQGITDRFAGRGEDSAKRPAGARPIRLLAVTTVDVEQEARQR